ncbi:PREDICTED: uncharacterized protein LOC105566070 [Vollenhovia emeryi]|uniref:uncharacterized protein LOC105566070 n=1 Tax=Vollenhovia emeryi TaxID=411798 RepID=UPI0005F38ECD|nr:PREDICTED: uncharacterized protein LOC105566070 [Vollenhovia emeryi]
MSKRAFRPSYILLSFDNYNSIVHNRREMLRVATKRVQNIALAASRTFSAQASSAGQSTVNTDVPGLSENVVKVPNTPVGPNASKDTEYKNPEYFRYHVDSFGEAEVELAKYRLPVPSNKRPFNR